ncbi:MAG TPA: dihydrodipicolinate synthase family protein [Armatimonadota bacterium]|nr:dihydrodipicolinate synthase family protein [Armatimonadota bacterium]
MKELCGVMTAIVTPFDAAGALMLDALPAYLEYQAAAGIEGVVVAGTNGEGPSLSLGERKLLLENVIRLRPTIAADLIIIAGTGAASITDAIDLTRHAGTVGADAALALPPFYFKNPSAQGVADYFSRVMDAARIPVLLYSIPQISAVPITDEVLALLHGRPILAGVKDSSGDWDRTRSLLAGWPSLKILPGNDRLMARSLAAGAVGSISGTANAFPHLVMGVKRAHLAGGDVEAAQQRLDTAIEIVMSYPFVAVQKSALTRRGIQRMNVRPPLVNLTTAQEESLFARLEAAGVEP